MKDSNMNQIETSDTSQRLLSISERIPPRPDKIMSEQVRVCGRRTRSEERALYKRPASSTVSTICYG